MGVGFCDESILALSYHWAHSVYGLLLLSTTIALLLLYMNTFGLGHDFDPIRPFATALPGWPGGLPSLFFSPPVFSGNDITYICFDLF